MPEDAGPGGDGRGEPHSRAARTLPIAAALLPIAAGAVHLFVLPMISVDPGEVDRELAKYSSPDEAASLPAQARDRRIVAETRLRMANAFIVIFVGCMVAALMLGLLNVQSAFVFAVMLGVIATGGKIMLEDGTGAFLGLIMFPIIPFWPLIGLGKGIRVVLAGDDELA